MQEKQLSNTETESNQRKSNWSMFLSPFSFRLFFSGTDWIYSNFYWNRARFTFMPVIYFISVKRERHNITLLQSVSDIKDEL